jgi:hypothetical protein
MNGLTDDSRLGVLSLHPAPVRIGSALACALPATALALVGSALYKCLAVGRYSVLRAGAGTLRRVLGVNGRGIRGLVCVGPRCAHRRPPAHPPAPLRYPTRHEVAKLRIRHRGTGR